MTKWVLRGALLALVVVGLGAQQQDEHSIPDGMACDRPTLNHPVDEAHACACHRECYKDESGQQHVQEDAQCKWYCKPDKCACGMMPCDGEGIDPK